MEKVLFTTAGDGYWSDVSKTVEIVDMQVSYCNDERDFGELRVYFNTATWDVNTDGLIYTDKDFIAEMRMFLEQHGLVGSDVDYSEQGMQGDDYVSCDVGAEFIASWIAKFGELVDA
jgi:precorrin isomerase